MSVTLGSTFNARSVFALHKWQMQQRSKTKLLEIFSTKCSKVILRLCVVQQKKFCSFTINVLFSLSFINTTLDLKHNNIIIITTIIPGA
jgi:hypothetical protein